MSLERDGELRAQLNLRAASPGSRKCVCVLYMSGSLSVRWHPLWQSLPLESKHICRLSGLTQTIKLEFTHCI